MFDTTLEQLKHFAKEAFIDSYSEVEMEQKINRLRVILVPGCIPYDTLGSLGLRLRRHLNEQEKNGDSINREYFNINTFARWDV